MLSLMLSVIIVSTYAQSDELPSLNIGDPAPPVRVREWIKGTPVERFEKGMVYVVEFWATWCGPCIAAMPHLSALAREYKDKVTILGVDIYETKSTSMGKIKAFVDSMGDRMDYHVAAEDSNLMATTWLNASGEQAIPRSFVVNAEGRVAWIGHPKDLDNVLPKIVNNTWDINEALKKENLDKYLDKMDDSINYELMTYRGDPYKADDLGNPDSALLMINEMVRHEPRLKYARRIANQTFSALLKTNPQQAYEYGKVAIVTPTYEEPPYDAIIGAISFYSDKLNLSAEIYQLGAEAYQLKIDQIPYPEIVDMSRLYNRMAEWFRLANDKSKAVVSQQKAIEALKSKHAMEMAEFESRLQQYKKM
jgi:thiol-disulfide isomerase/thioredoxin